MRITGGIHRGRQLQSPPDERTRPTSDRAREAVFNILRHAKWWEGTLEDATVLDAFAGTGALGLEALSQGAGHAVFIEKDRTAANICRQNIDLLKENGRTTVLQADALLPPKCPAEIKPRNLVFLDPPYGQGLAEKALVALVAAGWLESGALCVVEMSKKAPEAVPTGFTAVDERTYGIALVRFLRWSL